jgi:dTDP-4-amino-4,6-dideoxygalactose transaminase
VTFNSATSALVAAVGALEVGAGDEVICSPYTMSASATCVLAYNAIPVFADIEDDTFGLDPDAVAARITPRTRALVVVHLFGHAARMDPLMGLARRHGLRVIEDTAQAPGATYRGRALGTFGDIGVFSLNCHKTIQTGEGGVAVTDSDELALRLRLIRNHGEAVVDGGMPVPNLVNTIGWNWRMTEIEAAIGIEQLRKLEALTKPRIELAEHLTRRLGALPGIVPPAVASDCRHVYYVFAIRYDEAATGIPRDRFTQAMTAEGIEMYPGYQKPLYLQPLYQQRIAYGSRGCPFTCGHYQGNVSYAKGICPVTERLYERELFFTDLCRPPLTTRDMDTIAQAFEKVLHHANELRG